MADYSKQRIALRYWLAGAGFHLAAEALDLAERHHTGVRKDGSAELSHQVAICHYLRTLLPHLRHPQEVLAATLLHDIVEDHGIEVAYVRARFGDLVADGVHSVSKEIRGVKRAEADVFATTAEDPIGSVVKGGDRVHNLSTMLGAFSTAKMADYAAETRRLILPMLKTARRQFPDQEGAYENIKLVLDTQLALIDAVVDAAA